MANLLRGRTAVIIAHRLSTIVDAGLIVVLDGGLVVQKGTHQRLLEDPEGLYAQLCARQFGPEELERTRRREAESRRRASPPCRRASTAGAASTHTNRRRA
jgi:hypothetical protein